jgi:branched-subunit amino acid transport protein
MFKEFSLSLVNLLSSLKNPELRTENLPKLNLAKNLCIILGSLNLFWFIFNLNFSLGYIVDSRFFVAFIGLGFVLLSLLFRANWLIGVGLIFVVIFVLYPGPVREKLSLLGSFGCLLYVAGAAILDDDVFGTFVRWLGIFLLAYVSISWSDPKILESLNAVPLYGPLYGYSPFGADLWGALISLLICLFKTLNSLKDSLNNKFLKLGCSFVVFTLITVFALPYSNLCSEEFAPHDSDLCCEEICALNDSSELNWLGLFFAALLNFFSYGIITALLILSLVFKHTGSSIFWSIVFLYVLISKIFLEDFYSWIHKGVLLFLAGGILFGAALYFEKLRSRQDKR